MLSVKEKLAYGLGDTASNLIFQTVMLFLTWYYTDIVGISPAFVGTMFLIVRLMDAVTDPMMGILADRTRTRFGSYRPYLLWLAIPFGLVSVLAFSAPELTETGKQVWAFATYTLLMLTYTAINIPYSAMGGVLSTDARERVSIQSYRFVFGMLGGLIVALLTLPLVNWLGGGDKALGYQRTMILLSVTGTVMFLLCFAGTKERLPPANALMLSIRQQLTLLWKNDQWRVLCLVAVFLLTGLILRNTLVIYYVSYYLEREDLVTLFVTCGMVGNIAGCLFSWKVAALVSKDRAYRGLHYLAATFCFASFFVPGDKAWLALVLHVLWCVSLQMTTPLLWAKIADTVDYGEWQSGYRLTGVTYSTVIFFIKLGLAIGGAMAGWLLAAYGYQPDIEQSESVKSGIAQLFSLYPAAASVMVALIMRHYKLNNQRVEEIQQALRPDQPESLVTTRQYKCG